ncbi:MAG: hypothetical protein ACREBU_00230 [Nitrososphaera sp.]
MKFVDHDSDPLAYNSRANNLDRELIRVIVKVVSNNSACYMKFDSEEKRIRYVGLMGVDTDNPLVAEKDVSKLMDVSTNLKVGCDLIRSRREIKSVAVCGEQGVGNEDPLDYAHVVEELYPEKFKEILEEYAKCKQENFD